MTPCAPRCALLSWRATAATIALALLAACGGGASTPPAGTAPAIHAFAAEPAEPFAGEVVTLRPSFSGGAGRIEPDLGPVESGGAYPVGAHEAARTYVLVVAAGGVEVRRELRIPVRYRDRVAPLAEAPLSRTRHGAVRLLDGRVLLVSGSSPTNTFWEGSELYDPSLGTFSPAGTMEVPRADPALARLPGGEVLVLGGDSNVAQFERATLVEAFDPVTSTWAPAGHLLANRSRHTATLLHDGRVLVAGGFAFGSSANRAGELWVPGVGARPLAGGLVHQRIGHTATLLADGRVLLAGGYDLELTPIGVAEVFDPATEASILVPGPAEPRAYHAAVRLADGRVLLAGGEGGALRASAEIYDPATGAFSPAGALSAPRSEVEAVLLGDGTVLVAGGIEAPDFAAVDVVERWDPATGAFSTLPARLSSPRTGLSLTRLGDGRVLIAGGDPGSGFPVAAAELYE